MISSEQLQKIRTEARPLIAQQMDIALQLAAMRDVVATAGGDWSALKAVIKAEIQDKVAKVRDKAESTLAYADMLGLGNMNEFNSFAFSLSSTIDHDPETGEIHEPAAPATHPAKPTEPQAKHAVEDALLSASEGVHDQEVSTPSPNPSTAVDLGGGSENAPATVDTNSETHVGGAGNSNVRHLTGPVVASERLVALRGSVA